MSVLLKKVLLTDIEYRSSNAWVPCVAREIGLASDDEGVLPLTWDDDETGNGIVLIFNSSAAEANDKETETVDFNDFEINALLGPRYTLFHSNGVNQLGTYENRKTTMIRYKTVCVIVDGGTNFYTKTTTYSYAMIKSSFDVDNTLIEGSPTATVYGSMVATTLKFRFPGFTEAQVGTDASDALTAILNQKNNWLLLLTKEGRTVTLTPTSLTIGTPVISGSYTDFGIGYIPMTLGATFTGISTGTYNLTARFKKNDEGDVNSYLDIPEPFEITVQLTVGTATPTQPLIVTDDGNIQLTVAITTGMGV